MVYTFLSEIEDLMTTVENFVIFHQTVDLDLFRVVLSIQAAPVGAQRCNSTQEIAIQADFES